MDPIMQEHTPKIQIAALAGSQQWRSPFAALVPGRVFGALPLLAAPLGRYPLLALLKLTNKLLEYTIIAWDVPVVAHRDLNHCSSTTVSLGIHQLVQY